MFRRKWFWIVIVLIIIGGAVAGVLRQRQASRAHVSTAETLQKRDLEAIVSASGKIDPKKTVNISAQSMGRVTRLAVNEGDRVKAGQFLLQIDPVDGGERRAPRRSRSRRRPHRIGSGAASA